MTTLHAGGKFGGLRLQGVGGLHGVGVSVVNALSEWLEVEVWTAGKKYLQRYERGKPTGNLEETGKARRTGTRVTFLPTRRYSRTGPSSLDILSNRLREMAFLNRGLRIALTDERADKARVLLHRRHQTIRRALEREQGPRCTPGPSTSRRSAKTPASRSPSSTTTATQRRSSPSPTTSIPMTAAPT